MARPRTAFTLIELLVVLVIILALVALTVGAFRRSPADRINASARLLQSRILLARSIAARDQRVTGLRLVQSANDPWVVDTVEMIKSPGFDTGTLDLTYVTYNTSPPFYQKWLITSPLFARLLPPTLPLTTGGNWDLTNPSGRGLIRPGSRIEIPAGSGRWYSIQIGEDLNLDGTLSPWEDFDNDTNLDVMLNTLVIEGHYTPSAWNSTSSIFEAQPATGVPYRLELAPTVTAGEEPLRLQPGTAIDLAACLNVPLSREILFAPGQGLSTQNAATGNTSGNICLYLTTLEDVELTRNQPMTPPHPAISPGPYVPQAVPRVPANAPAVPKNDPAALAIYAQTGNVISVPVDLTPVDPVGPPLNLRAVDPYVYARSGREANR